MHFLRYLGEEASMPTHVLYLWIALTCILDSQQVYVQCWPSISFPWSAHSCKYENSDIWKMVDRVNILRLNASLPVLTLSQRLCSSARMYAWEQVAMIAKGLDSEYEPHIGMNFSTPRTRMQANGFMGIAWGENEIFTATNNIDVAQEIMELDPENRKNLLGDYDKIGIGFAWIACRDIPVVNSLNKIQGLCNILSILPESKRYLHVIIQQLGKIEPDLQDLSRIDNNCLNSVENSAASKRHYLLKPFSERDIRGSLNITEILMQQVKEQIHQRALSHASMFAPVIPPSIIGTEIKNLSMNISSRIIQSNQEAADTPSVKRMATDTSSYMSTHHNM